MYLAKQHLSGQNGVFITNYCIYPRILLPRSHPSKRFDDAVCTNDLVRKLCYAVLSHSAVEM